MNGAENSRIFFPSRVQLKEKNELKWKRGKIAKKQNKKKKKTAVKTKQNMMDWYGLLVYVKG